MKQVRLQVGIPAAGSSAKDAENCSRQVPRDDISPRKIVMRSQAGRAFRSMAEMEAAARGEEWHSAPVNPLMAAQNEQMPDPEFDSGTHLQSDAVHAHQSTGKVPEIGLLRFMADRVKTLFRSSSKIEDGNS